MLTDKNGKADVFVPAVESNHCSVPLVAAAVAVIKRSWGWDESEWIEVRQESTQEYMKVSPEYDGEKWLIEIHPGAAA